MIQYTYVYIFPKSLRWLRSQDIPVVTCTHTAQIMIPNNHCLVKGIQLLDEEASFRAKAEDIQMNVENFKVPESKEKFKKEKRKWEKYVVYMSIGHRNQPEQAPNGLKLDTSLHPESVKYDVSQSPSSDQWAVGRSYTWAKRVTLALDEAQKTPLLFLPHTPASGDICDDKISISLGPWVTYDEHKRWTSNAFLY